MTQFYSRGCIVAFLLFFITLQGIAQPLCGFDDIFREQLRQDPEFRKRVTDFETFRKQRAELMKLNPERRMEDQNQVYEIPVVFHIIHTGSAVGTQFNPSQTRINQLMSYLNDTYAATWMNYPGIEDGGVSMPLRFVLAKRDPDCNPTNGINRVNVSDVLPADSALKYIEHGVKRKTSGISDSLLKSIIRWDNQKYYNIWVVNKIDSWSGYVSGSGVVGYAYYAGARPSLDGTVIMEAFNRSGQTTLPHELGHAFNLLHTFEGGCTTGDCNSTGDYICDTEPHTQVDIDCATGNNPCSSTPWGQVKHNIMNYSPCPDRFTGGQRDRMLAAVLFSRPSLLGSLGGVAPGAATSVETPIATTCGPISIASPNNLYGMGARRIRIGSLEYFTSSYAGDNFQAYFDYTLQTCLQRGVPPVTMEAGKTYPVEIMTGTNPQNVRVWIDFNNNGTFSANELVFASDGVNGVPDTTHTGNTIEIPATVERGVALRMRVYADYYTSPKPTGCITNLQYGQIEDFSVIVHAPLPVSLANITAKASPENQRIDVEWSTASESNVSHYEVFRSLDGTSFEKLASMPAMNQAANYRYADTQPVPAVRNFYKIKMADRDGNFTFSKIVSALAPSPHQTMVRIFPNPATQHVMITSGTTGVYHVTITNMMGQIVLSTKDLRFEKGVPVMLGIGPLKPGLYQVQLRDKSGAVIRSRFMKE